MSLLLCLLIVPTQCIMYAGLLLSAHANNGYYELVKVVNNAICMCLAARYPQTGMQSPIESEYKIPIST